MKLEKEKEVLKEKIKNFGIDEIKEYSIKLKESKQYNNFEVRLSFDVLNAIDNKCNYTKFLYETYNCNDTHIETLLKKCLKELNII